MIAILNSLEYAYQGPYSSGHLPITEDIQINGTVVITPGQIEVPEECLDREDCRNCLGFSNLYETAGVSLISNPGYVACPAGTLTLTNVKVRFRKLLIDTHPWIFNFIPVIQVLPPSDHPCEASEIKCDHDHVCYRTLSYCQYCLGLSHQACVCRDESGVFPDGTVCEFFLSGDVIITGECQDGQCTTDWL